jgi:hypothetical protein
MVAYWKVYFLEIQFSLKDCQTLNRICTKPKSVQSWMLTSNKRMLNFISRNQRNHNLILQIGFR